MIGKDVQAGNKDPMRNSCSAAMPRRSRLVAAIKRKSEVMVRDAARASRIVRPARTRSSFGCSSSGKSATSSRNSVPLCASSTRPRRWLTRSRERAFLVAEHFAFEQARRDGRAVQLDERRLAAAAELMHGARDQFLASSGLALYQDRGIGGRGGLHLFQHVPQRGAAPDDFVEAVLAADFLFEINFFSLDLLRAAR